MPSPRPPALGLRSFPTHRKPKRNAATIPPRARQLVELMTLGPPDGSKPPMALKDAADAMGITYDTAAQYFRHPRARAVYLEIVRDLRTGEMMQNTIAAVEIRDDPKMKASAAGARARIEAARFLEDAEPGDRRNVNPGVSVTPGIVVTVNVNRESAVDDTIIEVNPTVRESALPTDS